MISWMLNIVIIGFCVYKLAKKPNSNDIDEKQAFNNFNKANKMFNIVSI